MLNIVKINLAGRRVDGDDADGIASTLSRTGDPREVLGGPLLYTWVLLAASLFFFRSAPAAVGVAQMAVGDGLADIVGRRFGAKKWFFNADKSYAGSLAFVGGAGLASFGLLKWFGLAPGFDASLIGGVLALSCACALVEVLPPLGFIDDNLSVPAAGAALALLLPISAPN